MKTVKSLNFGFSAINAGQRNNDVEPQLIAVSTEGGFRITPPVSRVLGVEHGEYIMFLSNIDNIDQAIAGKDANLVAFCEEQGLDITTPEAAIAIHKEFDMVAIAKGIKELDAKGNMKTVSERLTKKDKITTASQHFDEMFEQVMTSGNEELIAALTREGITKEEQIDVLATCVVPAELPKFKGSKVANPGNLAGIGCPLNFTDNNIWKQLKADMGDEATSMNRIFDLDIENVQDIVISNGYEEVTVKALILGESTDKEPARVGKNSK